MFRHVFSNVPFGVLSGIIDDLVVLRDSLLVAGNLQPPYDEDYWSRASDIYLSIVSRIDKYKGVYEEESCSDISL